MSSLLSAEQVSTGYSQALVLHDINVTVEPGEIIGVLGANGAGKTTLLRVLAGVLPLWSGAIHLLEHDLSRAKPWTRVRAGLAHVQEGRHVFTAMTVEDNLAVAELAVRGRESVTSRSDVYDLFPRLAERRNQLAGTLSGGEQQMLAIGRALATSPSILLVDEMSAGLAPVVAQQLVEALTGAHERGIGVVLVEQSPHLVAEIVDRVYLLERGRVVGQGPLADLGGAEGLGALYLGLTPASP